MYTSTQVMRITGVSYRRLNHWISRGFIPGQPPLGDVGSGAVREWSREDLARVIEIRDAYAASRRLLKEAGLVPDIREPAALSA